MKQYWLLKGVKFFFFALLMVVLFGLAVMLLWNWLIPAIFAGPAITFIQALGLLLLAKILFGGFGRKWGGGHHRHHWRGRWKEKWANMSEEERRELKEKWARHCGPGKHRGGRKEAQGAEYPESPEAGEQEDR